MTVAEAIARHAPALLEVPGVVGLSEGVREGRPVVQVMVVRRTPALDARLPATLEGHPVVLVESGEIRAQDSVRR